MARYDDDDDDDRGSSRAPINNNLVMAILSTICCGCLPFGIVSIVNAAKVNGLVAAGRRHEAQEAADAAKKWAFISWGVGIPLSIISVIIQIMAAGAQQNQRRF